jgi:hypothetical protein
MHRANVPWRLRSTHYTSEAAEQPNKIDACCQAPELFSKATAIVK